jgi:SAM-dependent methyltransferase
MRERELSPEEATYAKYSSAHVVAHYAGVEGLAPAEEALFASHLAEGMSIIDIGVGGGPTTRHLAPLARLYVGIDYSPAMINACRRKYPGLRFEVCDASDMSIFPARSFDAAIFTFNGIDYLATPGARAKCLAEVARLLVDDGVFIFSSHNAKVLGVLPQLHTARGWRIPWRVARAAAKSLEVASRNLRSGAFREGEGYVWDPHHGGLWTYVSTPATIAPQLRAVGLEVTEVLSGLYPEATRTHFVPWHHYACRRGARQ